MAGVVAMASVIEDFDTQPCKKSRSKDGGSPVVKTITNYFSPVPKPVEKPFSPPRSNNIMDYFNKKPPLSKEKTSSPEQSKENCQTTQPRERATSPEASRKPPSQKRNRKASKAARKLVQAEPVGSIEESCLIVEDAHDGRAAATEAAVGSCNVLGSDTAALLLQATEEPQKNVTKTVGVEQAEKDDSKRVKVNPELYCIELSPIVPSKDKAKLMKTAARNSKKRQQREVKLSEQEEKAEESSLCDVSMEVNVDEVSQLHNTVTVSFEEFLRSQSQGGGGEEDMEDEEGREGGNEADQSDMLKAVENVAPGTPPLQISPRTLTIQAEVHAVSHTHEAAKVGGKVVSIFNRRKEAMSPAEALSPKTEEAGHKLPPPPSSSTTSSLTVKRKSNVVLQEEDLELAVLESESTPKCSMVERKTFMAAFKQPGLEGAKAKPGKSQGKQKQPEEKALEDVDKVAEEVAAVPLSDQQVPTASQEDKAAKKKPARKGRKKAVKEANTIATAPPAAATVGETVDSLVDDKSEEPPITSTPSIPAARRSRREAAVRQAPEDTPTTPVRKNRKRNKSKDAAVTTSALPDESPAMMSTPKTRKSKHGVYLAEMVCPPDTEESPIRIKFTRVHKNVSQAESGRSIKTSLATKESNCSKKRKQAKKLVEKARVIQQTKKAAVKEQGTLRRSSRAEASAKRSYCEDEDSVICLEEDQTAGKSHKSLRSLNDVLGKAAGKETKAVPGSKVSSQGQEKATRRASAVISIFDESSQDGSENSKDDEQFKARRDFLKSGLPDSFRKQIAKTAATKEAYSVSCSSFQPVIHMKQTPNDCPLWSLQWPESALLCHLKELWWQTSHPLLSVSSSLCVKTKPVRRAFCERGSGWRPEISESIRQLLLEEVSASNPPFPAQKMITHFLKRRSDHQQQCSASEPEVVTKVTSTTVTAEPVVGKRKRTEDEGEMTVKVAKKQRADSSEENTATPEPTKRGGRTRRAQRSNEKAKPSVQTAPIPSEDECVFVGEDTGKKDVVKEDVLWTDKYQPQHSSDIIGNNSSVRGLHSWLKEWKLRTDREERKKQKDKKEEEGGNDSEWDCGEEDSQDGEDTLCNTMLITGPSGVGKTAAVYACAQELGFKVFEVNASSQRSGRLILSQLKEATQSHQVDSQGVNAHKPTYFNSYSTSSPAGALRPGSSPRKVNSPRGVVSSPRKHPQSPRGSKRGNLAPTALANFFKMGQPTNKETTNTKKNEHTAASKKVIKANECAGKRKEPVVSSPTASDPKEKINQEQSKKTATSLILFEEVDVIFDDDSGFLAAIKTFMTTTKRPVILTTSDPSFSTMFDGNFEEVLFKTPSVADVGSFLRLLCLAEDTRTDLWDVGSLLTLNGCDIRQSLLQLQFWTRSGGGRNTTRPLTHTVNKADLKPDEEAAGLSVCAVTVPPNLHPCDSGCTESMLGLLNTEPQRDIWDLFKSRSPAEEVLCWELLTNSRRRGVDLLYCNMETLLPLPLTQLTTSTYNPVQPVSVSDLKEVQADMLPSQEKALQTAGSEDCSDDGSPVKMSNRMRKLKRRMQDGLHSDSDSEESFVSLCKPQGVTQAKEEDQESLVSHTVKRKPLTAEERLKSLPVSQCLESIADFMDNMSYMDSSLLVHPEGGGHLRRTSPVGAVVKDGMTDESRVEMGRGSWARAERVTEISAAVEALSFHRCGLSVAQAWDQSQQLEGQLGKEAAAELSLPVATHRRAFSFTQDGPCQPQVVEQRREVMETLLSRGVFGSLGNRAAAAVDYLPALRTICRSEQLKEQGKVKRRFLHYLDAIHLGIEKSTLQHLAEDFP